MSLKAVLFFFLIFTAESLWASEGCFSKHIRDAIKLNQFRKEIYASFYGGETRKISDRLIFLERRMAVPAWISDQWNHYFHSQSVSILCSELQDMSLTPPLPNELPLLDKPLRKDFIFLNADHLRRRLNSSLALGMDSFIKHVQIELDLLKNELRVNCLVRHFLESLRSFAKSYQKNRNNLPEEERKWLSSYIHFLLKGHIFYLRESHEIDKMALESQTKGIPIICQDVPPIPDV